MEFIKAISPFFVLLPLIIGHIRFDPRSIERSLLLLVIELAALSEILMAIFAKVFRNNMPVVHFYTLLEFCLLISIFHFSNKAFGSKKLYILILGGIIGVFIGNVLLYQGIWEGNSFMRSIEGVAMIVASLYYFFDLLKRLDTPNPGQTFSFWISIAMLVYFGGNLLLFIYFNKIQDIGAQSTHAKELMLQIGLIGYILNIFLYSLYSIALLCKKSKPFPRYSLSAR